MVVEVLGSCPKLHRIDGGDEKKWKYVIAKDACQDFGRKWDGSCFYLTHHIFHLDIVMISRSLQRLRTRIRRCRYSLFFLFFRKALCVFQFDRRML